MFTRPAAAGDIPALRDLLKDAHARSRHNETRLRANDLNVVLTRVLANQSATAAPDTTIVFVADRGDRLDGIIVGIAQRLYFVLDELCVYDQFFYTREDASARVMRNLQRALHDWAASASGPVSVRQDVRAGIGDPARTGPALARAGGMTLAGFCYEKRIRG